MLNWFKENKSIVVVVIMFCVMLGFFIKDTIAFNKETIEADTVYVDTTYVVVEDDMDTLETIEIDSTSWLINSDAVD